MFSQSPVSKSGNNKKNNVETQLETEEDRSAIISHFGKMVDSINLNYSSQKLKLDKIAEYVDTANKSDSEIVDKNTAQTSGDNSSIVFLGENSQANVLISYTFWIKGSEFPLKSIQKSRSSINEDLDILELGNHSKKSLETKFQESVDNNLEIIGRQLIPSSRI